MRIAVPPLTKGKEKSDDTTVQSTEPHFDDDGHDTHVASIAAGNVVCGANLFAEACTTGFKDDLIAQGVVRATRNGILTICCARNDSPQFCSIKNVASWILTVGATIEIEDAEAFVASFSSRGPPPFMPQIIKPDVVAPSVDILGASPFEEKFELMSGTLMATPYVSGVTAMTRRVHLNWPPAAVK
ncbi:hypothetical protein OROMI_015860 [Orobanche minor]